jgi:O-antigen ligase
MAGGVSAGNAAGGVGEGVTQGLRQGLVVALLVLPWLNPFAGGPSPSVEPWLFAFACVLVLRWLQPRHGAAGPVLAGLALLAGWAFLRSGFTLDTLALAGGCLLVALAAGAAAHAVARGGVAWLVNAWLLAAVASTGIALLQYFGAGAPFAPWVTPSPAAEAFANLRQRNQFACLTVIGSAAVLWHLRHGLPAWGAAALVGWLAVGNAATTSRTGLLQLVLLGAVALWWAGQQRRAVAAVAGTGFAAYSVAAFALPWLAGGAGRHLLWERVAESASCSSRRVLWSNVAELAFQRPFAGWGWGELDYAHFMRLYEGDRFCDILDNAHNLPLHLAVELGLPLLLVALLWCGVACWRAAPWREADATRQLAWSVLLALAVHSLLEYPLWYGPFQLALGLCLGLLWPSQAPARRASVDRVVVAVAACAALFATWDYRRVSQIYRLPEERAPAWRENTGEHIARSWLFRQQARFALLTLAPLTRDNAAWTSEAAEALLHYSPEPKIIEKAIESATMLGRYDEAVLHLARYRAAFPVDYRAWSDAQKRPLVVQ